MEFVTRIAMVEPDFYVPLARAADEAGFDGILLADSIGYLRDSDSRYPYTADGSREFLENKPFLEPMIAMAAMAAATSRITLCPGVLKLPIRHPVLLAKQATSLAVLSHDRLLLGVGTSPWPDDYELVGLDWSGRGRRFVECLEILRGLGSGEYFEYHGEFYDFPAVKLDPTPATAVPVVIGGNSSAMVERAAALGDGWMPSGLTPERLEQELGRIRLRRAELGRTGRFSVYGGVVTSIDEARALERVGVTHVVGGSGGPYDPYGRRRDTEPMQPKIDRLRRFGDEVIGRWPG